MNRRILVSIAGNSYKECGEKIEEIKKREISRISLFLQYLTLTERKRIYDEIKKTRIEEIPIVHIGKNIGKNELKFLFVKYRTRYFTIHESDFNNLVKWKGFYKYLFLEMSTDNIVNKNVKVEKIGGFCVDLAHYQKQKDRKTIDYKYVYDRRNSKELFECNHLSGYSFEKMEDLHHVKDEKDFNYIKKLPKFVFGKVIAIEVDNAIEEQLKFKKYIEQLLKSRQLQIQ